MDTTILKRINYRTLFIDAVVLLIVYMIPAYSHFLPIPIYYFDPMRVLLLASYILTRNNSNTILLAISLPIFTSLISGHPPIFKAILISIELLINILVLIRLLKDQRINQYIALVTSILFSKVVYYLFKFLFIKLGLINGTLISTDLWTQAGTILLIFLFFRAVWRKNKSSNSKLKELHQ